jgi:hypothetical protein
MLKSTGERVVDVTSTGDVALWGPGFVPHIVRAASITLSADCSGAGDLAFDLRPTRGDDTSRTSSTVAAITVPVTTAWTAGSAQLVYYDIPASPVTVYPGQEVVAEVTDAITGPSACQITLWVEPVYQAPGNIATLTSSGVTMTASA